MSDTPRRVVILKPSALGDIAHALPVLSAVRELFPTAHVAWVVNAGFAPLLHGHPHLNEVIPFDRGAFRKGAAGAVAYSATFARTLWNERFDLAIDLQGLLRTGLMTAATGARVRIGFANAREGSVLAYTRRVAVPDADRIHAVDRYWQVVDALGGGHLQKRFVVPIDPAEREAAELALAPFPRPWVAVAVGAKWLTKRWPPAHFAELLNRGLGEFGGTAVFVGAPEDIPLSAETVALLRGPSFDLTGKTSVAGLAAVLATADVMLANDTGPLHLAAALGKPCVAPYTCTLPVLHGPYPVAGPGRSFGVPTTVPCAGSYFKTCPNGMICMGELTPGKLWPAFHRVLSTWASERRGS